MKKQIIETDEEIKCSECNYPLYKGDEAFTNEDNSKIYCSRACYRIGESADSTFNKVTPKGVQCGCFDV